MTSIMSKLRTEMILEHSAFALAHAADKGSVLRHSWTGVNNKYESPRRARRDRDARQGPKGKLFYRVKFTDESTEWLSEDDVFLEVDNPPVLPPKSRAAQFQSGV